MYIGMFGLATIFVVAGLVFWIVALVDALKRPAADWEAAGQNQVVWVLVILFANLIGALIYWAVARPQLDRQLV